MKITYTVFKGRGFIQCNEMNTQSLVRGWSAGQFSEPNCAQQGRGDFTIVTKQVAEQRCREEAERTVKCPKKHHMS